LIARAKQTTEDAARRELARGTLELAILYVLSAAPRYGYELMSLLRSATDGALELKEGTLYPVLHRLEDGGLVAAYWEAEGRTQPRKYYKVTSEGRARSKELLNEWRRVVDGMTRLMEGEV
jgi:PadR family transcriptional regulator, regulatory protein PadR